MGFSLLQVGALALAVVGEVSASQYYLSETYDSSNFFDKFNFFESVYNGTPEQIDPTHGFVQYQNESEAWNQGLINTSGSQVYIGVDHTTQLTTTGNGRSSVRIESKEIYNKGHLFITRFNHIPTPVCGSWPAFWSYGDPWPTVGEIDFIEYWDGNTFNTVAAHTNYDSVNGTCSISSFGQTATVESSDCDTYSTAQSSNEGCTAKDNNGVLTNPKGGIYAMEWTDDYIKLWSWTWDGAPANVNSSSPDTTKWGTPTLLLANGNCNIDEHFASQKLVLNIDFCGDLAGNPSIWDSQCALSTGYDTCVGYVAAEHDAFQDTYWLVTDIRVFTPQPPPTTSSSTSSWHSTTTSSSSSTSTWHSATSSSSSTSTWHGTTKSSTTSKTWAETSSKSETKSKAKTSAHKGYTTSTVYTTKLHTVTSCAPEITNCPAGPHVSTETVVLYTTVCPVEESETQKPTATSTYKHKPTGSHSHSKESETKKPTTKASSAHKHKPTGSHSYSKESETKKPTTKASSAHKHKPTGSHSYSKSSEEGSGATTVFYTKTFTVTSCASSVTNCPVGKLTSEVVTETYCSESTSYTTKVKTLSLTTTVYSAKPSETLSSTTTVYSAKPSETVYAYKTLTVVPQPIGYNLTSTGSTPGSTAGSSSSNHVTVNGAMKSGVSFALVAAGAFAVLAL